MASSYQHQASSDTNTSIGEAEASKLFEDQGSSGTPDLASMIRATNPQQQMLQDDAALRHQVELLEYSRKRRSSISIVDIGTVQEQYAHDDMADTHCQILSTLDEEAPLLSSKTTPLLDEDEQSSLEHNGIGEQGHKHRFLDGFHEYVQQIPAILTTVLLILMTAIPFGVAYFPVGWANEDQSSDSSSQASTGEEDDVHGTFPFPGKEAMGSKYHARVVAKINAKNWRCRSHFSSFL